MHLLLLFLSVAGVWSSKLCSKDELQSTEKDVSYCYRLLEVDYLFPLKAKDRISDCRSIENRNDDCYMEFKKTVKKQCSNQNLTRNLQIYSKSFNEGFKLFCRNEGINATEFAKNKGLLCYAYSREKINSCLIKNPLVKVTSDYSESFCRSSKDGLKCVKKKLNIEECKEEARNFLYKYYKTRQSNTPCGKSFTLS